MRISSFELHRQASSQIQSLGANVAKTQQQISNGKRIVDPSDDPVGAAKAIEIKQAIGVRNQFIDNASLANGSLAFEESILNRVTEVMHRVQELTIQSASGIQTADDREFLATEIRVRFDELVSLANSRAADGQYIFAGFRSNEEPFTASAQSVSYNGDSGQRQLQVGRGQTVNLNDAGNRIFMRADTSDVKALGTNQLAYPEDQNATISSVDVVDQELAQSFLPDKLVIEFRPLSESGGEPNYSVVRLSDQRPVDGLTNLPFRSGDTIEVQGFAFSIDGDPAEGDKFVVESHQQQGILDTVRRIANGLSDIDALAQPDQFRGVIDSTLEGLSVGLTNILEVRADIGARLNTLDATTSLHEEVNIQMQEVLSDIEDLDFAEAVSNLSYQSFVLEAAQQSFVRIAGLSLFNFLR